MAVLESFLGRAPGAVQRPGLQVWWVRAVLRMRAGGRRARRRGLYRHGTKRALDLVLTLAALPAVLPLILVLAALVALDGGRPFYVQTRLGYRGRRYRMWKLRTMRPDAEAALVRHLAADPAACAEWTRRQKLSHDPRITPLGRVLRKCSADELPQLWNVLCGEMSLVGPRPMMPEQAALYPGRAYWRLRPGLTGPWQISGRNATSFAARARFDALYDRRLSLATDLRLIGATLRTILRGTGC